MTEALANFRELVEDGDYEEALGPLQAHLAQHPQDWEAHYLLGVCHFQLKQGIQALDALQKACANPAAHAAAHTFLGKACHMMGNPQPALAAFEKAVSLDGEGTEAHMLASDIYMQEKRWAEASALLEQVLERNPRHAGAHYSLGMIALEQGNRPHALRHISRASAFAPYFQQYLETLNKAIFLPQVKWHMVMMNNALRNTVYDEAAKQVIQPGDLVLDIGTGGGLTALMSARAGAGQVITCEMLPYLAESAQKSIERNGYANKITVLNKWSRGLKVGEDLPQKADVLISEIFGSSLLEEDALFAFMDAKKRLLKPGGTVIPGKARVMASMIESRDVWEHLRVDQCAGFDMGEFNNLTESGYMILPVHEMPHTLLAEPVEILAFDFNGELTLSGVNEVDVAITQEGRADCWVLWFELETVPGQVLNNGPHMPFTSFQQKCQALAEPFAVKPGDTLRLGVEYQRQFIFLDLLNR